MLTVDYGDLPPLVVVTQGDSRTLAGSHNSDRAAVVCAVQVRVPGGKLFLLADGVRGCAADTEGISGSVLAVRLKSPLHNRLLDRCGGVLALQNHRLEQHGYLFILRDGHLNTKGYTCKYNETLFNIKKTKII